MTFKLKKETLLDLANDVIENIHSLPEKELITKFYEKLLAILSNKQNPDLNKNIIENDDATDDIADYDSDNDFFIRNTPKKNSTHNKKK